MAKLCTPIHSPGPVNAGEKHLFDFLQVNLPDSYYIIPNGEYPYINPNGGTQFMECDCIVVAPHAIYLIENKDYKGRLEAYDSAWFHNDREIKNPIKGVTFKGKVLSDYLKRKNGRWKAAWIESIVTLSNLNQNKSGFEVGSASDNKTFLLNDELINFIKEPDRLPHYVPASAIASYQFDITDYLMGSSVSRAHVRTNVCGMIIDEILDTTDDYIEYLCHKKFPTDKKYKVRDYALNQAGMSPVQIEKHEKLVHNGEITEDFLPDNTGVIIKSRFESEENHYYVITPYQDDRSLRSEMARNTFTELDKIQILLNVAEALSLAHEQNVIHRDVRPENIFIQSDRRAALANFGLAYNEAHDDASFNVTVDLEDFDLNAYTSEDVFIGDYSAASDVYSFGVLAYELMTGQKFPFDNFKELLMKGGKLPKDSLPSAVNSNVEKWVDELCERTIVVDPIERWANIDEVRQFIFENGIIAHTQQYSVPEANENLNDLKPTDRITNDIVLGEMLGEGGFSKVFKAKHQYQPGTLYAAKIFKEGVSPQVTVDEFKALNDLNHPNIVRFRGNGTTNGGLFYTLMDYVDGTDIRRYASGDTFLSLTLMKSFLKQMISALVYIQEKQPPVIHRDIKPENIMYRKDGSFVLIDFNIATNKEGDRHKVGTYRYVAPDLTVGSKMNWDLGADTFALGVTAYELLSHIYPWGNSQTPILDQTPVNILDRNHLISDKFAKFIMKACETRKENRFQNAKEMQEAFDALERIDSSIEFYSKDGTEYNIVDYINSLYSQSERGNAGTRAGFKNDNILDKLTYTETRLDTKLLEDIKHGDYKLIIITGNAGDGKTAFIRQVENAGTDLNYVESRNGAKFRLGSVMFESNYDGSQDEHNLKNNDVLAKFFAPFIGIEDYRCAVEGRIIAINEGRLMEYLESTPELTGLHNAIDEYFYKEGVATLPDGVMVINLNLRSVTALDDNGDSLLRKQVKALTDKKLWNKCLGCPIADRCFIKYNVDSLNDSAVGNEIIKRLEWIVRTIVYKRELHITMRDLRSIIAWMLTRDYTCADMPHLIELLDKAKREYDETPEDATDEEKNNRRIRYELERQRWWTRYYFNITAPEHSWFPNQHSEDRVVKLLRETDIANVAIPELDRNLYFSEKNERDYLSFAERTASLIPSFNDTMELKPSYMMSESDVRLLKLRHQTFIRHQYFEGAFLNDKDGFMKRLPFQSIGRFVNNLNQKGDDLETVKNDLAYAISCSEGCWNRELSKEYLLLSSSRVADPSAKSYRRFPLKDFEMEVDTNDKLTTYLEHENCAFVFRSKTKKHIQLNVSLELYEMLSYIENGFSPSVSDLKGRFIELQVFKNLLESETYTEIIVTNNEKDYYRIRLNKRTMRIVVTRLEAEEDKI